MVQSSGNTDQFVAHDLSESGPKAMCKIGILQILFGFRNCQCSWHAYSSFVICLAHPFVVFFFFMHILSTLSTSFSWIWPRNGWTELKSDCKMYVRKTETISIHQQWTLAFVLWTSSRRRRKRIPNAKQQLVDDDRTNCNSVSWMCKSRFVSFLDIRHVVFCMW